MSWYYPDGCTGADLDYHMEGPPCDPYSPCREGVCQRCDEGYWADFHEEAEWEGEEAYLAERAADLEEYEAWLASR